MVETAAGAVQLSYGDLALAAGLVAMAGAVSLALRLGLEKRLALAATRTAVQLFLVGFVLKWVFDIDSLAMVVALALGMAYMASRAAVARSSRRFAGVHWRVFLSLVLSGFVTTVLVTAVIVRAEPWHKAQYAVPLLGMILGNGLTGLSLCIDALLEAFSERRQEVELELALGATRWEAARGPLAEGVRRGMIPIINSMTVVGIVSLPGMMTGQILAGADPLEAVKYQIVVMFMIAAAVSMSSMAMALFVFKRLFNSRHQLEHRRIVKR